jgi:hypothetical protein
MSGQLTLDVEPPRPNPNAGWFDNVGRPRRLLWCSDSPRLGGRCPYGLEEPRERGYSPACCKARKR